MQGQPNQVADIAHVHGQVVMTLCSAWLLQQSCVYHYVACLCVIAQQACTYMITVLNKSTVSMNRRSPTVSFQRYSTNRSTLNAQQQTTIHMNNTHNNKTHNPSHSRPIRSAPKVSCPSRTRPGLDAARDLGWVASAVPGSARAHLAPAMAACRH